ncbi:MAG: carbohydrate binding domain-containing protein [Chitinispirillaceae bacterium]|nr:carbohydrate binding domain-containing protein [Chitinispirillaceae bacterium]
MSPEKRALALCFLLYALSPSHAQNLVVNGSFENGSSGWDSLLVAGPAQATKTISGGAYRISITTPGSEPWHVQLKQGGIAMDSGAVYQFSFDAWADAQRDIEASVGMDNGPYTLYSPANEARFRPGTAKQRFGVRFKMRERSDPAARVQFNCGASAGTLSLSGITLEKITTPMLVLLSPGGGEAWSSATVRTIEWLGIGMDRVHLFYSLDAGLTWNTLSADAPNSGSCAWRIPEVTSPWCLVRVADAAGSGLADTSDNPFEIGAFFNIVRNGAFSDSAASWDNLGVYGGAAAAGSVENGAYAMVISNAGSESWNVQLTQTGVTLMQGETYLFSFTAWADAARPLRANIGQAGGAFESYLDDTGKGMVVLSTASALYALESVMLKPTDTNARLEFNAGTAAGTVFIDNVSLYRKRVMGVAGRPAGGSCGRAPVAAFSFINGIWLLSPESARVVRVKVFDVRGKTLKTILPDRGRIVWDGRSDSGVRVSPGAYLVQIRYSAGCRTFPLVVPCR